MQGSMVDFPVNGKPGNGYLAVPESGGGPGVIVIQEWWGLVDHIKDVVDRFAAEGFVALAPDMYNGESTSSPDDAGKLMMALDIDRAAKDLSGAIGYLLGRDEVTSSTVGTVGFCMGGQLSLYAACENASVGGCVVFYGIHPNVKPNLSALQAPVLGFFAEKDEFVPPAAVKQFEADLQAAGKSADITVCEGVDHAFFNDTRDAVYDPAHASTCWSRMLGFYREHVR